jgi:receptor protein-tyrosine kinase
VTPQNGGPAYSPLRGYLDVLLRRKWYVLLAFVLAPAVAVAYSFTQPKRYEATAKVLLSRQNLSSALSGANADINQDPNRFAQTQVEIARVPALALRVLRANHLDGVTAESFLHDSRVIAEGNADILEFRVRANAPARARLLATSYAREFTTYRRAIDAASFARAERALRTRLQQLRASGEGRSRLYANLLVKEEQLRTLATLGTSNAVVLRAADDAVQVQPRPVRNGILAGLLGLLLGVVAAAVIEALDMRARSAKEISGVLGVPLLGRVPQPRRRSSLVMVTAPSSADAEAFRMLRSNLDLVLKNKDRRTIMVTSALGVEGKTTTLSKLAVALALAGRHVIAVDLDLRRPSLHFMFGVSRVPGVSDIVAGGLRLDNALMPVPLRIDGDPKRTRAQTGRLEILPSGTPPLDPGEFVGRESVALLIRELRSRADVVLVDAPPLLQVGDAMTLSEAVDGLLLVVRPKVAQRDALDELGRVLTSAGTEKLGFVLTGSRSGEIPGYGTYYAS